MKVPDPVARHADALLATVIAALFAFEIAVEPEFGGDRGVAAALAAVFCASLVWRRHWPIAPLAAALVIIEFANEVAARQLAETGAFLFGMMLALYAAGAHTRGRTVVVAGVLVMAMAVFAAIEPGETTSPADVAFFIVFFGGPFVLGRIIRWRRGRETTLVTRMTELVAEGDERARAAVAEERARMARELHDVVAHAVSVMLLQARGARKLLDTGSDGDPGQVRSALDTIDASGRTALEEMRRLLTVLRPDGLAPELGPQPSLRQLEELVAGVRAAGLPVELNVSGSVGTLPPGVDVSAYRIVQEALTNVLRHAGPATARVRLNVGPEELEIDVVDDGSGTPSGAPGYGLIGMRERVAVHGGQLETGRGREGGFALRARLPLRAGT